MNSTSSHSHRQTACGPPMVAPVRIFGRTDSGTRRRCDVECAVVPARHHHQLEHPMVRALLEDSWRSAHRRSNASNASLTSSPMRTATHQGRRRQRMASCARCCGERHHALTAHLDPAGDQVMVGARGHEEASREQVVPGPDSHRPRPGQSPASSASRSPRPGREPRSSTTASSMERWRNPGSRRRPRRPSTRPGSSKCRS
jgi:hypothetical protein